MGDVHCRGCGEPWDTFHLRHHVWYDMYEWKSPLSDADAEEAAEHFNRTGKILDWARRLLAAAGWQFGSSVLVVKQCPACSGVMAVPVDDKADIASELESLLGHDPDALQAELEDLDQ